MPNMITDHRLSSSSSRSSSSTSSSSSMQEWNQKFAFSYKALTQSFLDRLICYPFTNKYLDPRTALFRALVPGTFRRHNDPLSSVYVSSTGHTNIHDATMMHIYKSHVSLHMFGNTTIYVWLFILNIKNNQKCIKCNGYQLTKVKTNYCQYGAPYFQLPVIHFRPDI